MSKPLDLTFKRFGRLVAVRYGGVYKRSSYWLCRCNCGNLSNILTTSLVSGRTQSCGCYRNGWPEDQLIQLLTR